MGRRSASHLVQSSSCCSPLCFSLQSFPPCIHTPMDSCGVSPSTSGVVNLVGVARAPNAAKSTRHSTPWKVIGMLCPLPFPAALLQSQGRKSMMLRDIPIQTRLMAMPRRLPQSTSGRKAAKLQECIGANPLSLETTSRLSMMIPRK